MVVLTALLVPIALAASTTITNRTKEFVIYTLLLEAGMIGAFLALDLFLFFVFFEAMLIPMYFIIGIWGTERRIYAAVKFFIYTAFGSALMLAAIIGLALTYTTQEGSAFVRPVRSGRTGPLGRDRAVVLRRLCHRLRHQGPAVPVPHLAPRCPRRGAHRGFGAARRRPPEAGDLRASPLQPRPVPRGLGRRHPDHGDPGRHRDHLRRGGGHRPTRPEEARRLFLGEPPRVSSCSAPSPSPRAGSRGP